MLIDHTYFTGEIIIPNTDKTLVSGPLNAMIESKQSEFLERAMGYALSKAFTEGLTGDDVDQKWTDLLAGKEYTGYDGRLRKWKGIVPESTNLLSTVAAAGSLSVIAGGGGQYDPTPGGSTATIPASIVGKKFTVELRGVGELLTTEYSISGNQLTLIGKVFSTGDVMFYKSASLIASSVQATGKTSMLANYIYYYWMRDAATQSMGIGQVAASTENGTVVSPADKMCKAWNEMVDDVHEMWQFLSVNATDYPDWDGIDSKMSRFFQKINPFGL